MKKYFSFISTLAMLLCIYACSDALEGEGGGHETATPLTREILKGRWTIDLDGQDALNISTALYVFNDQQSYTITTITDIDNEKIITDSTSIDAWDIEDSYLATPNKTGHREALCLKFKDRTEHLLVDHFDDTSITFYVPLSSDNEDKKVEIRFVRQEAEGNRAQLVNMTKEELETFVNGIKPEQEDKEVPLNSSNWMASVKGDTRICDMAIPGTHDSATSGIDQLLQFSALTQGYDLETQWDMGVRAFDIRVRNHGQDELELCHGPIPCNQLFKDGFAQIVSRVLTDQSEFAIFFINSETNPMSLPGWIDDIIGGHVEILSKMLSFGLFSVREDKLDELTTRKLVYRDIKNVLTEFEAEDRICYYRPDLTLSEARGKIIIMNRLPDDYKENGLPFIGQGIISDDVIVSDDPSACPTLHGALSQSNIYFAFKEHYGQKKANPVDVKKLINDFNAAHLAEFDSLTMGGYKQRAEGKTSTLFYNNVTSAYPVPVLSNEYTELPNYVDAANVLYPEYIKRNESLRTCGIIAQDFAGVDEIKHFPLNDMVNIAITTGTMTIIGSGLNIVVAIAAVQGALYAAMANLTPTKVYGNKLLQGTIALNFVEVPLESADISKRYIEVSSDYTKYYEQLSLTNLYPRDANTGLDVKSWTSDNPNVATVSNGGMLNLTGHGNAIITATMENGYKTIAYVNVPLTPILAYDLGLSVNWGNRNIGAASPEYAGPQFAWGELEPRTYYRQQDYRWFSESGYTKYCQQDKQRQLSLDDDIAHQMLGGKWRMPTKAEIEELINGSDVTATTLNGVNVLKITRNGKTIYLPESPYRNEAGAQWANPAGGYLWTSSIAEQQSTLATKWDQAYCLRAEITQNHFIGMMMNNRYYAMPIRPVKEK